ncbi:MAG: XTP/dITP diphosphatase [Deltaproteobacteria bacterium]|nr:XTP/dITP diphosphatase [Deltaproteobacteria bacterium]
MTTTATPLILATYNTGKTREIRSILKNYPVIIRDLSDFGVIPSVEEDGATFEDNAFKKASFTAKVLGLPTLADDSGLVVPALNGAPGIYSARYAGPGASDADNNQKLLREMQGIEDRSAVFECVLALAVPTGPALIYEGRCEGLILEELRGSGGFGYDPLFFYPPLGKTFAELSGEEKNEVSHRGRALRELAREFDKVLIWLRHRLEEAPIKWA